MVVLSELQYHHAENIECTETFNIQYTLKLKQKLIAIPSH